MYVADVKSRQHFRAKNTGKIRDTHALISPRLFELNALNQLNSSIPVVRFYYLMCIHGVGETVWIL